MKREITFGLVLIHLWLASCALHCGAKIDLVDINSETYNLDVNSLSKKLKIAQRKKATERGYQFIFAGLPCEMKEIYKLSKKYKFKIVEDAHMQSERNITVSKLEAVNIVISRFLVSIPLKL